MVLPSHVHSRSGTLLAASVQSHRALRVPGVSTLDVRGGLALCSDSELRFLIVDDSGFQRRVVLQPFLYIQERYTYCGISSFGARFHRLDTAVELVSTPLHVPHVLDLSAWGAAVSDV